MVPQSFVVGGNRSYPNSWAVTGDPWYPGYKTLIVAPEPFVKQVIGVICLMRGRIGTHMILWVPPWDSEV
jgi:hypothetical protein